MCCLADRSTGWQLDDKRRDHLPGDDPDVNKTFVFVKAKVNTQYMQCVLQLAALFARGLPRLAVRQTQVYYHLVLRSNDLGNVLPGRPAIEYQQVISLLDGVLVDDVVADDLEDS